MQVYLWNARLSAALLYHFHIFEVTLRNAIDEAMRQALGPNWLKLVAERDASRRALGFPDQTINGAVKQNAVSKSAMNALDDAIRLAKNRILSREPTHNDVVATSSLGLWIKLLGSEYDLPFWQGHISKKFTSQDRAAISNEARQLIGIRNRVAHHEHIILEKDARGNATRIKRFLELLEYKNRLVRFVGDLDPILASELGNRCDFEAVLDDYFTLTRVAPSTLIEATIWSHRREGQYALFQPNDGGQRAIGFRNSLGEFTWKRLAFGKKVICHVERDTKGPVVREVFEVR